MTEEKLKERGEFDDEQGRRWEVQVLWGHPHALPERGIYAARYRCLSDESEPVRVGHVQEWALADDDLWLLREMLAEAEPGREIG
jgi:hypothetical protein